MIFRFIQNEKYLIPEKGENNLSAELSPDIINRYHKMRKFCRDVNRDRRQLRNKVDLLCRDLIQYNGNLTSSLHELQRIYDFQTELTGEFDLRYMLHKALRQIKNLVADSSALFYLSQSNGIEAHISGPWYQSHRDLEEIEQPIQQTIIPEIIGSSRNLLIPDAVSWQDIPLKKRRLLGGLSLLGLPVICDDEVIGGLVIYRDSRKPLTTELCRDVQPYVYPLARAVTAILKLQPLITH